MGNNQAVSIIFLWLRELLNVQIFFWLNRDKGTMEMSSNGKWIEFKFDIFINFRDAIDNEAEPNANRNQEGR